MRRFILQLLVLVLSMNLIFAGEYTEQFRLKVEAEGESLTMDPVESFNEAVEFATQKAESQGAGILKGYSESREGVLQELWIKKEAHLQVVDLQVYDYKFRVHNAKYGRSLITAIKTEVTMDYLDIPKFQEDYNKTISGAALRSMAIPGWGQIYNRQYMTAFLFGLGFWTFYGSFIGKIQSANGNVNTMNDAFIQLQIPAMILWSLNLSDAITSRYLGHQGLNSLKHAYRLSDTRPQYELRAEQGFKIDLIFYQFRLY